MDRETATKRQDLPHRFNGGDDDDRCTLCQLEAGDPLHLSWVTVDHASRETATHGFTRELGT